ncbi:FprA family A-type flavoprotein [Solibaculum mannosilyticum]|uniref:FprA family A-type flavoprotein n=1 Tax=Solibaculum mannosilyticum TaxID=2780922 RepID=A0A7I8D0S9_9FIRM|nr:FprA family A-type flavoprotein [Solibaculum mannosilyticum]BCI60346.1 FprA family A-type flavoprotein [Solibaculum mannosilyticum]
MHCTRKITDSISWVGGCDRRLALFENLFPLPRGVAYNSYLIMDEKTALIDTVDSSISRQFVENVLSVLNGRTLDYLVVNHMEPDHCANIADLMLRFPDLKIVGNTKTFTFIRQFYNMDLEGHTITVQEGDTLSLGQHTLRFYFAPMVHWPEVMVTYEESEKLLFSADAFGSFGALNGALFNDEVDFDRDWLSDARRYYGNIVGKYGPQVQSALKKLSGLDIRMICPLHGLVWRNDLGYLLDKYDHWSRYQPEEHTVAIFYGSMYGDTENAVDLLASGLVEAGVKNISVYDVSSTHVSTLISEVFRCSHLVLASPTYNNGIYPAMLNFLHDMKALNLQNRTVALIQNGSWAPASANQMKALLSEMKGMQILDPVVTIKSSPNDDTMAPLIQLKESILSSLSNL